MLEARLAAISAAVRAGDLYWTDHYIQHRLPDPTRPRRRQIREALMSITSEIIEDYAVGHYGPSSLIWSQPEPRIIHVQCTYPPLPKVVTAYWPDSEPNEWVDAEYKVRR